MYQQEPGAYVPGPPGNIFPTFAPPPPPVAKERTMINKVGDEGQKLNECTKWGRGKVQKAMRTYGVGVDVPRPPPRPSSPNPNQPEPRGVVSGRLAAPERTTSPPARTGTRPNQTGSQPDADSTSPNQNRTRSGQPEPIRSGTRGRRPAGGRRVAVHGNLSGVRSSTGR